MSDAKILAVGQLPVGTASKTIDLPAADAGLTTVLFVMGPAIMTQVGTKWIQDDQKIDQSAMAVYRRRSNGPTKLEFTQNAARAVSYVAIQGDFGALQFSGLLNRGDARPFDEFWGTWVHNWAVAPYQIGICGKSMSPGGNSTAEMLNGNIVEARGAVDNVLWSLLGDSGKVTGIETSRVVVFDRPSTTAGVQEGASIQWDRPADANGQMFNGVLTYAQGGTPVTPPDTVYISPGPVTGLAATPGDGQVSLSWAAATGSVTGYAVAMGNSASGPWTEVPGSPTTNTSLVVTGLTNGTPKHFVVASRSALPEQSAWSSSVSATPTDVVAPGPVTALTSPSKTGTTITLSWTNPVVSDLKDIIVRYLPGATAPATAGQGTGVTLAAAAASTVVVTGLLSETQYSFAVFARDTSNNISPAANLTVTTNVAGDVIPPGPVTNLRIPSAPTSSTITLAWNNPTDLDLAEIIVRRELGGAPPASSGSGTPVPLSLPLDETVLDFSLSPGTPYSYAVYARDTEGNTSPASIVTAVTADGGGVGGLGLLRVSNGSKWFSV